VVYCKDLCGLLYGSVWFIVRICVVYCKDLCGLLLRFIYYRDRRRLSNALQVVTRWKIYCIHGEIWKNTLYCFKGKEL